MIPDTERPKPPNPRAVTTTSEPEQGFLQRQLDTLLKDPNRDARAAFRHAANSATAQGVGLGVSVSVGGKDLAASTPGPGQSQSPIQPPTQGDAAEARYTGVVGPMGTGGLSLPGVEKAMAEMEGEDVKDRFARISRRVSFEPRWQADRQDSAKPTSPGAADRSTVPNEALHNFVRFQVSCGTR
jgi:dynein light intermediate chain 1